MVVGTADSCRAAPPRQANTGLDGAPVRSAWTGEGARPHTTSPHIIPRTNALLPQSSAAGPRRTSRRRSPTVRV